MGSALTHNLILSVEKRPESSSRGCMSGFPRAIWPIGSGVFSQKMNDDALRANPGEAALMRA